LRALEVYRRPSLREELSGDGPLVDLGHVRAARSVAESMALNDPVRPCVVVSASGMATGGRVVHHLRHMLPDRRHTVVLTGYQAVGTRGRALLEGATELKMHGRYVRVRAEVVRDEEFSVHADADELLAWVRAMPEPPRVVHLVHGEPAGAEALGLRMRTELDVPVVVPRLGERVLVQRDRRPTPEVGPPTQAQA
jgi:metallo-beta-lactamase family protein